LGGFNLPLFILFLLVTVIAATSLLYLSELPKLVVFFLAPLASYFGLFGISQIIDLIERKKGPYNMQPGEEANLGLLKKSEETDLHLPEKPEGHSCPSCGSNDIGLILYGFPSMTKQLEKALKNKEVTLGGCLVYDEAPQWVCNACSHKFGKLRIHA